MSLLAPAPKKEKILLIEGEAAFGARVVDALKAEGYETTLVANGTDGLKQIYDMLPHLILIDVVLPGLDGYEVLAKKHAEPLLAKIPVFLISTQGGPISMQKVPQNSVTQFIMALNVSPADIVAKVNAQFGYQSVAAEAAQATAAAVQTGPKIKILWVEDDKLIGTILGKKLTASGFDLLHAKNGEDALKSLKDFVPDVIVLDLLLPGMSGFEILQKIKMDPKLKGVPSMILSNFSKPSDFEKAKVLGADKFLVKAALSLDQVVTEIRGLVK